MLVATSAASSARFTSISVGGTVAANPASYAATAEPSWPAVCSAWAAVVFTHDTYGATAAAIVIDDGPNHGPPVSSATTARYVVATELNSAANPLQASAAVTNDPDPAPAYIRP